MVLPERDADWRPIQESVFAKIRDIFMTYDEEEEQKAYPKLTYDQMKNNFKQSISILV